MGTELFSLGEVITSPAAATALAAVQQDGVGLLSRHQAGDWGDEAVELKRYNDDSLRLGLSLLSVYTLPAGVRVAIHTNAVRSQTEVTLESELGDYWANRLAPHWQDIYGNVSGADLMHKAAGHPLAAWLEQEARAVWGQDYADRCLGIDWNTLAQQVLGEAKGCG